MVVAAVAVLSQRTRRPRRVKPPDTHADDRVLIRAHRPGAGTDCINYENSQSIRRWVPPYVEPAIATRFKKVATTRLAKTDIGHTHNHPVLLHPSDVTDMPPLVSTAAMGKPQLTQSVTPAHHRRTKGPRHESFQRVLASAVMRFAARRKK